MARQRSDLALDARQDLEDLVHHSDRGVKYVSIRYSDRLAEAGLEPSVGSRGEPYDNAPRRSTGCTRPR